MALLQEEIEEAVHKVCSFVPAEVKDFCDKFLEEQAEVIINKLVETLNPEGLCTSAGLCNDHSSNGMCAKSHNVFIAQSMTKKVTSTLYNSYPFSYALAFSFKRNKKKMDLGHSFRCTMIDKKIAVGVMIIEGLR